MSMTVNDARFPNRQRDVYPADAVPRLAVDGFAGAARLRITDTTFRDGQQASEPFPLEAAVALYRLLVRLDAGSGRIAQSEFFLYGERDRRLLEACREVGAPWPEPTAWIRADARDLAIVREAGLPETGILCSASDHHIAGKLGLTRAEAFDRYLGLARAAVEAGIRPRCHLEDVTRADVEGFVLPLAAALAALERDAGVPVKLRLCDTLGLGVPWREAPLPRSVPRLVEALVERAGVAPERLEWHGHDDLGKVHANSTAAWLAGCAAVNGTLGGIGERTGNEPIELAAVELQGLAPDAGLDLGVLGELPAALAAAGLPLGRQRPLLGADAFLTRAGVHIDGLLKDPEIYLPFPPQLVGRRADVALNDRSGAAGVAWTLGRDKHDPIVQRVAERLRREYEAGRRTEVAPDEVRAWAAERYACGA
jgi:isopropylmalate/homocitrate/citramalate synthase